MAQIGSFDATTVAPREDFSPIPAGEYLAQIVDSDMKPTKNGNGQYAELTFEVMEGDCKSRRVWSRLNLDNPNPKAVEIAQRDLSAICHAAGKLQIRDTQELHYKPMLIRVEVSKREGYADSNEIKAYKPAGSVTQAPTSAPAANQSPDDAAPWLRNKVA